MRTTGERMTAHFVSRGEATVYGNGGTHTLFRDKGVRNLIFIGPAARYILTHVLSTDYDFMFIKNIDSFETTTLKIQKSVDFIYLKLPLTCPRRIRVFVKDARDIERVTQTDDNKTSKKVPKDVMPKRVKGGISDFMMDHYQETERKPIEDRIWLREKLDRELDQISKNVKAAKKKIL